MSGRDGLREEPAASRMMTVSDAEERLIYAYISGNKKDIAAAKDSLSLAHDMSDGQLSSEVIERLIQNDPVNAARAGLLREQ